MVRHVKIETWCSRCYRDDEQQVEAPYDPQVIIEGNDLTLDLCKDCYTDWYEPWVEEATEIGLPTKGIESGEDEDIFNRLRCPFHKREFSSFESCRNHLQKQHPKFWAADESLHWRTPPGGKPFVKCDYCEVYKQEGTGMAAHVRTKHPKEWAKIQAARSDEQQVLT